MELFIFARFHAKPEHERELERELTAVVSLSRTEEGCISIHAFQSTTDARLFHIHSRWKDEAAFELHATLPHTVRFVGAVQALIDHELEVTRARVIG